jgi:hypothetical protein
MYTMVDSCMIALFIPMSKAVQATEASMYVHGMYHAHSFIEIHVHVCTHMYIHVHVHTMYIHVHDCM